MMEERFVRVKRLRATEMSYQVMSVSATISKEMTETQIGQKKKKTMMMITIMTMMTTMWL